MVQAAGAPHRLRARERASSRRPALGALAQWRRRRRPQRLRIAARIAVPCQTSQSESGTSLY